MTDLEKLKRLCEMVEHNFDVSKQRGDEDADNETSLAYFNGKAVAYYVVLNIINDLFGNLNDQTQ